MLSHTPPMSDIDPCRKKSFISNLAGLVLSELTKRYVKHLRSNMRSEIKQHLIYYIYIYIPVPQHDTSNTLYDPC